MVNGSAVSDWSSPEYRVRSTRMTSRSAFTLVEVMVVVVIISLLAAFVVVAGGAVIRQARKSSEEGFLRALNTGAEQFSQQFGFAVPLVDDDAPGGPIDATTNLPINPRVRIAGESAGLTDPARPLRYLRMELDQTRTRFSVRSLPYYVVGLLPQRVDGVDGPGFGTPAADGSFSRSSSARKAMVDLKDRTSAIVNTPGRTPAEFYPEIHDRYRQAIRYYRWEPTRHVDGAAASGRAGGPANNTAQVGEIRDYNVPGALGDPRLVLHAALRSSKWAIVSAGADRVINDDNPADAGNADNVVIAEDGSVVPYSDKAVQYSAPNPNAGGGL
jgi:prepilin-type N-terminal cleavage/methylation domain-containing protein